MLEMSYPGLGIGQDPVQLRSPSFLIHNLYPTWLLSNVSQTPPPQCLRRPGYTISHRDPLTASKGSFSWLAPCPAWELKSGCHPSASKLCFPLNDNFTQWPDALISPDMHPHFCLPRHQALLQLADFHTILHVLPPWFFPHAGLKSSAPAAAPRHPASALADTIPTPSCKPPTSLIHRLHLPNPHRTWHMGAVNTFCQ